MRHRIIPRVLLALAALVLSSRADEPAPKAPPVEVTVDVHEVPELEPWANEAKALIEEWYPKLSERLASPGFTPSKRVRVVFRKNKRGVADTGGSTISIAADWVKQHPEDRGMVIHELCHVIQAYPRNDHGWLVEGIADEIRFFEYEPQTVLTPPDPARSGPRDSYRTTAAFLAWVQKKYDPTLVSTLNAALREGRYKDEMFEKATGKSIEALWKEYIEALPKKDEAKAAEKGPGD